MSEKTAKERVLEALMENGQKTIPELARELNISKDTARASVVVLAMEGRVRRIVKSAHVILWEAIR